MFYSVQSVIKLSVVAIALLLDHFDYPVLSESCLIRSDGNLACNTDSIYYGNAK